MTAVATYDTTLRDGAQQSVSLTMEDKLAVFCLLDDLGAAYVAPGGEPPDGL